MLRVQIVCFLMSRLLFMITAYSSPKLAWPLLYTRPSVEIIHSRMGNTCATPKGEMHHMLKYNSVLLQGDSETHIDMTVDDVTIGDDFTFIIFAKAMSSIEGTLFHYKTTDNSIEISESSILEIILFYNATYTSIVFIGRAGEVMVDMAHELDATIYMNDWISIGVSYDYYNQKIRYITEHDTWESSVTGISTLHLPGVLRIGSSFNANFPNFDGSIICANLYDEQRHQNNVKRTLQNCLPSKWPHIEPEVSCRQSGIHFELVRKDSSVDQSIVVLYKQIVTSRVRCADLCKSMESCLSFTFNTRTKTCRLYDTDHSMNMVAVDGEHYYTRKHGCC